MELTKEVVAGLVGQPVDRVCAELVTLQVEHGEPVKVFPIQHGSLYTCDFDPGRIRVAYDPKTDRVTEIWSG